MADDPLGLEVPREPEAGGTGLIDVADLGAVFGELPVEAVQGVGMGRDGPVAAELAGGVGDGHGDGLGVDIETDVFDSGWRG